MFDPDLILDFDDARKARGNLLGPLTLLCSKSRTGQPHDPVPDLDAHLIQLLQLREQSTQALLDRLIGALERDPLGSIFRRLLRCRSAHRVRRLWQGTPGSRQAEEEQW